MKHAQGVFHGPRFGPWPARVMKRSVRRLDKQARGQFVALAACPSAPVVLDGEEAMKRSCYGPEDERCGCALATLPPNLIELGQAS